MCCNIYVYYSYMYIIYCMSMERGLLYISTIYIYDHKEKLDGYLSKQQNFTPNYFVDCYKYDNHL